METNLKELPQLSFTEALKKNYEDFTDLKGRSRRSELWWNYLVYFIVSLCVSLVLSGVNMYVATIVSFLLQLWVVPITIRRMHDREHSGVWGVAAVVISLVTNLYGIYSGINTGSPEQIMRIVSSPTFMGLSIAGFIVNLVILVFSLLDSSKTDNRYGPSPKYVQADAE